MHGLQKKDVRASLISLLIKLAIPEMMAYLATRCPYWLCGAHRPIYRRQYHPLVIIGSVAAAVDDTN